MRRVPVLAALLFCVFVAGSALAQEEEASPPAPAPALHPDSLEGTIEILAKDAENRRAVGEQLLKGMSSTSNSGGVSPELMQTLQKMSATKAGGQDAQEARPAPDKREPMSLSDARFNFSTVVEARVAKESKSGYWPFPDPKSDKVWPLIYKKTDLTTIRELKDNLFAACVLFSRKDRRGLVVDVDFTVDFSGAIWKVAGVKLHSVTSAKGPPAPAN